MPNCKPLKIEPTVKGSETWGIFKILAYAGQKLIETKNPHYEHTFLTKCLVCGKVKRMRQSRIKSPERINQRWCRACPPESRKGGKSAVAEEAKRRRAERSPNDRRNVNVLAESTKWR